MTYQESRYGASTPAAGGGEAWTGAQADKLKAAGWDVIAYDDYVMMKPTDSMPDVDRVRVNLNPDGTLHLVTARSDFHRKLKAILG